MYIIQPSAKVKLELILKLDFPSNNLQKLRFNAAHDDVCLLYRKILKGLTILLDALKAFYPHFITPVYSLGRVANVFYLS